MDDINDNGSKNIPSSIKTASIIYRILGYFILAVGGLVVLIFLVMALIALFSSAEGRIGGFVMLIWVLIAAVIFGAFVWLYLAIASGLERKQSWARIVGIIFAILMLMSVPIGTALGIVLLINLFNDETERWIES